MPSPMTPELLRNLFGPAFIQRCTQALERLASSEPATMAAVVATADGFALASVGDQVLSAARLAALASSLQALGQAALRELDLPGVGFLFIENERGKILVAEVSRESHSVILCVACGHAAISGRLLWAARQCAAEIATAETPASAR